MTLRPGPVLLAAAALAACAWVGWSLPDQTPQAIEQRAAAPAQNAALISPVLPTAPPDQTPQAPLPDCAHQHLDITRSGTLERTCVASTKTAQNGSVRSYLLEAEGLSSWRLVVDSAGGRVFSARLSQPAIGTRRGTTFFCENDGCSAISIGKPDAHGVRGLRLDKVPLQALPEGVAWRRKLPGASNAKPASQAPNALHIDALLAIPPDSQQLRLACTVPRLEVLEADSALTDFCPLGSAGFEMAENGLPRFQFRDLGGLSLAIALAADGNVQEVTMNSWSCHAPQCGGIGVQAIGDASDPLVERHFSFSGTTLFDASSQQRAATLNGRLVLPAQ